MPRCDRNHDVSGTTSARSMTCLARSPNVEPEAGSCFHNRRAVEARWNQERSLYLDKKLAPANATDGHRGCGSCDVEREGKLEIVWSPVDETPIFTLTGARMRHIPMPPSSISHGSCQGAAEPPRLVLVARRRAECFQPTGGVMTNDKLVADLRKSFEGYAGPPANKGGMRLAC